MAKIVKTEENTKQKAVFLFYYRLRKFLVPLFYDGTTTLPPLTDGGDYVEYPYRGNYTLHLTPLLLTPRSAHRDAFTKQSD